MNLCTASLFFIFQSKTDNPDTTCQESAKWTYQTQIARGLARLGANFASTGGSCLSQIFGSMKTVWLKCNPAYPIIIISLIVQGNLAKTSGLSRNLA